MLMKFMAQYVLPLQPEEWLQAESPLASATKASKSGGLICGDDRDHYKAWVVDKLEAFSYILRAVAADTATWTQLPLTKEQVANVLWAKTVCGLPGFLRH